jgi:hypothetical protein
VRTLQTKEKQALFAKLREDEAELQAREDY